MHEYEGLLHEYESLLHEYESLLHEYEGLPATEECLSETEAAADAWLEPTAIPTSADAKATRSLMPSPQYMHVLPRP